MKSLADRSTSFNKKVQFLSVDGYFLLEDFYPIGCRKRTNLVAPKILIKVFGSSAGFLI